MQKSKNLTITIGLVLLVLLNTLVFPGVFALTNGETAYFDVGENSAEAISIKPEKGTDEHYIQSFKKLLLSANIDPSDMIFELYKSIDYDSRHTSQDENGSISVHDQYLQQVRFYTTDRLNVPQNIYVAYFDYETYQFIACEILLGYKTQTGFSARKISYYSQPRGCFAEYDYDLTDAVKNSGDKTIDINNYGFILPDDAVSRMICFGQAKKYLEQNGYDLTGYNTDDCKLVAPIYTGRWDTAAGGTWLNVFYNTEKAYKGEIHTVYLVTSSAATGKVIKVEETESYYHADIGKKQTEYN